MGRNNDVAKTLIRYTGSERVHGWTLQLRPVTKLCKSSIGYWWPTASCCSSRESCELLKQHRLDKPVYVIVIPRLPWYIVDNHPETRGLRPWVSGWLYISTINYGNRGISVTYPTSLVKRTWQLLLVSWTYSHINNRVQALEWPVRVRSVLECASGLSMETTAPTTDKTQPISVSHT